MTSDNFDDDEDFDDDSENFFDEEYQDDPDYDDYDEYENELNINPYQNVTFQISISISSLDFDQLDLYVKFPQSTRKQKVSFISSNLTELEKSMETFAAVYKYSLKPPMFINNKLELETIVNIDSFRYNFPIPKGFYPLNIERLDNREYLKNFLIKEDSSLQKDENLEFIANKLVKNSNRLWNVVQNIINWVNTVLFYDHGQTNEIKSLHNILLTHRGSCTEYAHLSLILLRIAGIPSRAVQGLKRINGQWMTHSWIEIYDPSYLWIPIDPSNKPPLYANLDQNFIQIFTAEDCYTPYYAVKVLDGKIDKKEILIEMSSKITNQILKFKLIK